MGTGQPTDPIASIDLSIVSPVLDERGSLPALVAELIEMAEGSGSSFELVFVDDGSTDGSGEYLADLGAEDPRVKVIRFARNHGKSAALNAGFASSHGRIVVTIDSDGQDDPAEIPKLVARLEEGYDVVSGWKRSRQDPTRRRFASRLFNRTTAAISGIDLHDFNCGLKAYRGERIRSLSIYGELHRFIPVLATQRGWRVTEVEVGHRPRLHGSSKFGVERYARGMLDLLAVTFIGRYENRPLHLFGGLGLASIAIGVLLGAYLTVEKISGEAIGDRPLLLLSVLLVVIGIQFLTFGLLAQMLVAMRHERDDAAVDLMLPDGGAQPRAEQVAK